MNILSNECVFNDYLEINKAIIKKENITFSRMNVKRDEGVGVLIYNEDTDSFVLIRQMRFPVYNLIKENIIEIVAGVVENNDNLIETIQRESIEECGYKIDKNNLKYINQFFVSPGITDDRISIFVATVTNEDKISNGEGLESENEDIEVLEIPRSEMKNYTIIDAKTIIALQFFSKYYKEVYTY